jgi:hypothetical protein
MDVLPLTKILSDQIQDAFWCIPEHIFAQRIALFVKTYVLCLSKPMVSDCSFLFFYFFANIIIEKMALFVRSSMILSSHRKMHIMMWHSFFDLKLIYEVPICYSVFIIIVLEYLGRMKGFQRIVNSDVSFKFGVLRHKVNNDKDASCWTDAV